MILDTSALTAIFFGEPEAALYTQLIQDTPHHRDFMSLDRRPNIG